MAKNYSLAALWKRELKGMSTKEFLAKVLADMPKEEAKQWDMNLVEEFAKRLDEKFPEGWTEELIGEFADGLPLEFAEKVAVEVTKKLAEQFCNQYLPRYDVFYGLR